MGVQGEFDAVYEDIYDAYRAAVQALGGNKAVASKLWPHKPIIQAQGELADALNRDRPRKLDAEECVQILAWACEAGFHSAKHYIDEHTGYEKTAPRDPNVEADRLADAINGATKTLAQLIKQAEALQARKPLKAVN